MTTDKDGIDARAAMAELVGELAVADFEREVLRYLAGKRADFPDLPRPCVPQTTCK